MGSPSGSHSHSGITKPTVLAEAVSLSSAPGTGSLLVWSSATRCATRSSWQMDWEVLTFLSNNMIPFKLESQLSVPVIWSSLFFGVFGLKASEASIPNHSFPSAKHNALSEVWVLRDAQATTVFHFRNILQPCWYIWPWRGPLPVCGLPSRWKNGTTQSLSQPAYSSR